MPEHKHPQKEIRLSYSKALDSQLFEKTSLQKGGKQERRGV